MADNAETRLWIMRLTFAAICLTIMYWQLLPLETVPRRWTGPDLLMTLCCVWVLRRPIYVPVLLIAATLLLADFLFQRPPGLMAAVVVLVTENLRRRSQTMLDIPFSVEWLTAAGAMVAIVLGNRILSAIFFLDQTSLGLSLIQLIMSVLAYPIVAFFCYVFLGLRKTTPRERDGMAGRI
ncbi:MAG: rod shape-determining protein MreD [Cognatishimia sp.]